MTGMRIEAIRRTARDPALMTDFYRRALRFDLLSERSSEMLRLRLVEEVVELEPSKTAAFAAPSNSTAFQHIAIIVSDMDAAMAHLTSVSQWTAISAAGAERLSPASGGVRAFKFRDPEGHPLELLQFPADAIPPLWQGRDGLFLGIDHSAITVSNTRQSVHFYEALGFTITSRQTNRGVEQARMDDVEGAVVEVTGLAPPGGATPHLELLCYVEPGTIASSAPSGSAFVFAGGANGTMPGADPDGHRLIEASGRTISPADGSR